MKKTLLALLLSLFALTAPAAGFYQEPGQLYGVYHIYDYGAFEKAKVPRGYKLLSINHYGRYGARYQDSEDAYTDVLDALLAGRRDGVLTPLGESVCSRTEAFFALCKDHYGELTERGWNQELCIAENMYRAAPASFWKKARITASSSMSRRCMMTMTAFCTGLTRSNPKLNLYACNSKTLLDATNPGDKSNVNYVETKPEPSPWGAS